MKRMNELINSMFLETFDMPIAIENPDFTMTVFNLLNVELVSFRMYISVPVCER